MIKKNIIAAIALVALSSPAFAVATKTDNSAATQLACTTMPFKSLSNSLATSLPNAHVVDTFEIPEGSIVFFSDPQFPTLLAVSIDKVGCVIEVREVTVEDYHNLTGRTLATE